MSLEDPIRTRNVPGGAVSTEQVAMVARVEEAVGAAVATGGAPAAEVALREDWALSMM